MAVWVVAAVVMVVGMMMMVVVMVVLMMYDDKAVSWDWSFIHYLRVFSHYKKRRTN